MLDTADAQTARRFAGAALVADGSGALYWPAERALLVADLHLEKGSAYAERGALLPPYDTRETLCRLAEAIDRYDPAASSRLGDSFHDAAAAPSASAPTISSCSRAAGGREWIWIAGNHDPEIGRARGRAPMRVESSSPASPCGMSRRQAASRTRSPATCTPPPSSPGTAPPSAGPASSATAGAW